MKRLVIVEGMLTEAEAEAEDSKLLQPKPNPKIAEVDYRSSKFQFFLYNNINFNTETLFKNSQYLWVNTFGSNKLY